MNTTFHQSELEICGVYSAKVQGAYHALQVEAACYDGAEDQPIKLLGEIGHQEIFTAAAGRQPRMAEALQCDHNGEVTIKEITQFYQLSMYNHKQFIAEIETVTRERIRDASLTANAP